MTKYGGPIIDCDVHNVWASDEEIVDYLPREWRDYARGDGRKIPIGPTYSGYAGQRGTNKRLETYPPSGGPPGSDYTTMRRQLLDGVGVERVILNFDVGHQAAIDNPYFSQAVVRAINEWQLSKWLSLPDERVYGAMLIPGNFADEAAAEIKRVGVHPRVAHGLLIWNSMGKPLGHPLYHPIYAAAAEVGLPIAIHVQAQEMFSHLAQTAAGGRPGTRLEMHVTLAQATMHHVASMITHGVFEKYPDLQVMLLETGVTWIPWLMWTLDAHYDLLRLESPWIRKRPSEYFRRHFHVTTQPLEVGDPPDRLIELLDAFGGLEDQLCFATDYPHWDADNPTYVARYLPKSWIPKVFYENAAGLYGWQQPVAKQAREAVPAAPE
jgi:uncharacterized protein